jgi:hypothetical protein
MVSFTPEPGQYLRILILYVRFPDDDLVGDQMNGAAVWWNPEWDKPKNPYTGDNKFIDQTERDTSLPFMTKYREYTISDYFSEMSMGKFDVIGDEYSITLPLTSDQYRALGYSCAQINSQAIKMADSIYNIDFSLYNNWSSDGTGWQWTPGGGDNAVDMIVMDYRRVPGYPENLWFINVGIPASGISDLGLIQNFYLDGTLLYSQAGVTCLNLMKNFSRMSMIMLHEMCHRYFFGHNELGLMTGAEHSSFAFSPRERIDIGYVTPQTLNYPFPSGSAVYTLGDFTATGDMLLFRLRNQQEDFIITNQQKASKYDGISRGSKECWDINRVQQDPYCPYGKGLFIFHEMPPAECNFYKPIIIEQADGNYNWYIDRYVPYFIPEYNFVIPLFERTAGNPNGKGEYHQPLDTVWGSQQEVNDNPCSDNPNDYFVAYDWLGDGLDAYNIGYDEQFTPYSNPRSDACDGSYTGLSVKLLSKDSVSGSITIKVYFRDNLALQELPPSKPKNLKAVKSVISPVTGEFHPKLSWDLNSEPDFNGSSTAPGLYNIYRGISLVCSPDLEPSYEFLQSVPAGTQEFTDQSISLYPYGGGPVGCSGLFRSLSYKVEAVDNTNLVSLRSDRAMINGYINRCDDSILVGGITPNGLPKQFSVYNYPNPFNPSTQIRYALPKNENVTIKVYDLLGKEIAALVNNEFRTAGNYSVEFDGKDFSSGVYFYVIEARQAGSPTVEFRQSKKMLMIK